jgi:hypothetical protein
VFSHVLRSGNGFLYLVHGCQTICSNVYFYGGAAGTYSFLHCHFNCCQFRSVDCVDTRRILGVVVVLLKMS